MDFGELQSLVERINISKIDNHEKFKIEVYHKTEDGGMIMYRWNSLEDAEMQKKLLIAYQKSHLKMQQIIEIMNDYNNRKWHNSDSVTELGLFERIRQVIKD